MGRLVVLMGPTGAGKSVQGELLAQASQGVHLSSGKLLRRDAHASATLTDGRLAPAEEVERVVGEAIEQVPEAQPIILDGFPRTMSNVEWMDRELLGHHRKLERVILIELDLDTIMKRLQLRGRTDDAPAAVEHKWQLFHSVMQPVVQHYRQAGLLVEIDGRSSVEEVHLAALAALGW